MTSRVPFYMLISLLIVVGLGMSIYRHDVYGVPWTAGQKHQVWEVEARVEFEAKGEPVKVSLATPDTQSGFTLINEHTSSPGYGFALVNTQDGRRAEWSKREATGQQILYFKNQMLVDENAKFATEPPLGDVSPIALDGPLKTAAEAMLEQARQRSADNSTLTRELIKQFNEADSQNASLLTKEMSKLTPWLRFFLWKTSMPA